MKKLLFVCLVMVSLVGCTDNQRARNYGGTAKEVLPAGQKLVTMTWRQDNMWILTRPMREGEVAESYTFKESSSFGLIQGTVVIIESK